MPLIPLVKAHSMVVFHSCTRVKAQHRSVVLPLDTCSAICGAELHLGGFQWQLEPCLIWHVVLRSPMTRVVKVLTAAAMKKRNQHTRRRVQCLRDQQ